MNTHDIELPAEFRSGNDIPVTQATIKRESMEEILRAAIKADRKQRGLKERGQLDQEWAALKGLQAQYEATLQAQSMETSSTIRRKSYAGVYVWIGDKNIVGHIPKATLENAIDPGSIMAVVVENAISKLGRSVAPQPAEPVKVPSDDLQGLSDRAYCQYIEQMRRTECLGWEQKVKDKRFGEAEMNAHIKAGEFLGRHRAFSEAAALLAR